MTKTPSGDFLGLFESSVADTHDDRILSVNQVAGCLTT